MLLKPCLKALHTLQNQEALYTMITWEPSLWPGRSDVRLAKELCERALYQRSTFVHCRPSVHEIHGSKPWTMHIFAKCFIRVYTDLYPDIQCSYAYIQLCISMYTYIVCTRIYGLVFVCTGSYAYTRSCISMYAFIRVYTQICMCHTRMYSLVSVWMRTYVYILSCTCIHWFVLSTDQSILSITLHLSHFLFHTKNRKQCYRRSAKQDYFLAFVR